MSTKESKTLGPLGDLGLGIGLGLSLSFPGASAFDVAQGGGGVDALATALTGFKKPLRLILTALALSLGLLLGASALAFPGALYEENFTRAATLTMIGLYAGTVPLVYFAIKSQKTKGWDCLYFLLAFVLGIGIALPFLYFFYGDWAVSLKPEGGMAVWLSFALLGLLAAVGLMVPGFGVGLVLYAFGFWNSLTDFWTGFLTGNQVPFGLTALLLAVVVFVASSIGISYFRKATNGRWEAAIRCFGIGFTLAVIVNIALVNWPDADDDFPDSEYAPYIQTLIAIAGAILGFGVSAVALLVNLEHLGLIHQARDLNGKGQVRGAYDFKDPVYDSRSGFVGIKALPRVEPIAKAQDAEGKKTGIKVDDKDEMDELSDILKGGKK